MGFKFNPFTSNLDVDTDTGIVSMGDPIAGADPNSVLISDSLSKLADVPLSTGQLLIGRTSNTPIAASLTGTANQVVVTNGSGSVTLSLPQSIATISSPSFANVSVAPSGALDTTSSGTLSIGAINASTINIGNSSATINVANKLLNLNTTGAAGSGSAVGIEVKENAIVTGYINTSSDRNSWQAKAPNQTGIITLSPGASGFTIDQASHNPVTLTTVGSTPNTSAASLSSQALTLQPADGSNPGLVTAGTQTIGGAKTFSSTISASNLSGTNSGDVTLGVVGSLPNSNGASLSGQVLTLQPADATNPGLLTVTTQTIAGAKTFSSSPNLSSLTASLPLKLDVSKNITSQLIDLTIDVTGALPIGNGGTGQITRQAAINALSGTQSNGTYLRSNGTNALLSAIQAADVPTLNQNTTGTASNVTGVVAIANGGTNSSTGLSNNRIMQSSGGAIVEASAITNNRALVSNVNGIPIASVTTDTELTYVSGVTSSIQTQLNSKISSVTGDIIPTTWNGLVNNTANQTITGLLFSSSISSFETLMNINITATSNTYTTVKLLGTRKAASDWSVNAIQEEFSGDAVTGLLFNITSAGQVQASIGNIAGFASAVIKFRAITL